MNKMDWSQFENKVADIFKLFGYDVVRDTKINSAQTDAIAVSGNKFKQRILIECKYHESLDKKVGIDEVENFRSRVLTLRVSGKIDQGYLVTNTGFTSNAKESISDAASYVFLTTYIDLIFQLVDVDFYLKNFVEKYEQNSLKKFVDLNVVDIMNLTEISFSLATDLDNSSDFLSNNWIFDDHGALILLNWRQIAIRAGTNLPFHKSVLEDGPVDFLEASLQSDPFERQDFHIHQTLARLRAHLAEIMLSLNVSLTSFLATNKSLFILLGDFGSGKSTSLNHQMYKLAKNKLANLNDSSVPIPLLLSLKNYNKAPDIDALMIHFFNYELGYSNINLPVFKAMNEQGSFVILLDGFDEMAKLVTPAERRLTFIEICKLITNKNKVILSSRPGYFPDNNELSDLLKGYLPKRTNNNPAMHGGIVLPDECSIACLQLMDSVKVLEYVETVFTEDKDTILNILNTKAVRDLATRPVLLNIISQTYEDLKTVPADKISLKTLYDIYTNKWINREEDKGFFRVLIDARQKLTFISLLAIQMFEQENLSLHFSKLDQLIQDHFNIDDQEKVDHFSHDIRTCSFLNRDGNGNYSFIHKSFLEYFVAREFSNFLHPAYKGTFRNKFNSAMWSFVDMDAPEYGKIFSVVSEIARIKSAVVKMQQFEAASSCRDLEKLGYDYLQASWPSFKGIDANNIDLEKKMNKLIEEYKLEGKM